MNTPTIKIILAGQWETPHLIIQIGNKKTAAHTESYANRANARRAQKTWYKLLRHLEMYDHKIDLLDSTVRAT